MHRGGSVPIRINYKESKSSGVLSCKGRRNSKMSDHNFNAENTDLKS